MSYDEGIHVTQKRFDEMVREGNLDFKNCFFSRVKITGDLKRADFAGAEFSECRIKDADFQGADFHACALYGGEIDACCFKDVNWTDATIAHTVVRNSEFHRVDFEKTSFRNGAFYDSVLMKECSFSNAIMAGTRFYLPPENMQHPKNYKTIKITMGGATDQEIQSYRESLLQVMGAENGQKIAERTSEQTEKIQEHNKSIYGKRR